MTENDDAINYLNSPLPGCEPPAATWGDFAEMLDQERFRVPMIEEEAGYMLKELALCFRRVRADQEQLGRAARMLRELSQLWGRAHGPGWLLTPKGNHALTEAERGWLLTPKAEQALTVAKVAGILDGTVPPEDDETPLTDAGEGC